MNQQETGKSERADYYRACVVAHAEGILDFDVPCEMRDVARACAEYERITGVEPYVHISSAHGPHLARFHLLPPEELRYGDLRTSLSIADSWTLDHPRPDADHLRVAIERGHVPGVRVFPAATHVMRWTGDGARRTSLGEWGLEVGAVLSFVWVRPRLPLASEWAAFSDEDTIAAWGREVPECPKEVPE